MRRMTLLGLTLLLPACQSYVGNPFDGFGGFIGDTHSFHGNPNRPVGNSANMLRVEGKDVEQEPLTPEPGNVWPRPAAAEPTLQDLQREQPAPDLNGQPPRTIAADPARQLHAARRPPELTPPEPATQPPPPAALPPATAPTTKFYPTPGGTAVGPADRQRRADLHRPERRHRHRGAQRQRHQHIDRPRWFGHHGADPALTAPHPPACLAPERCGCCISPGCASAWARRRRKSPLPEGVATVGDLVTWLRGRSPAHAAAFAAESRVRCAVNQEFAAPDAPVAAGDEVAFFPPVTGG